MPQTVRQHVDNADYPYGSSSAGTNVTDWHSDLSPMLIRAVQWTAKNIDAYLAALNRPPDFVVPKTFGMSAIIGIMTALAIVFGCLRWLDAWPVLYFFFAVQGLVICLAQMLYGRTP